jgi:hypothetical protein
VSAFEIFQGEFTMTIRNLAGACGLAIALLASAPARAGVYRR